MAGTKGNSCRYGASPCAITTTTNFSVGCAVLRSRGDQRQSFTTGFQAALYLHIARAIRTVDRQTDLVLEVAVEAPEDLLQEGLPPVRSSYPLSALIARIEVVLELDALQRDALQPLRQLRSARVCALLPVGKREP